MIHLCPIRRSGRVFLPLRLAIGVTAFLVFVPLLHGQTLTNVASETAALPDAPSAILFSESGSPQQKMQSMPTLPPPCPISLRPSWVKSKPKSKAATEYSSSTTPPEVTCTVEHPLRIVVDYEVRQPLTPKEKGYLAIHDVTQPFNLLVIAAEAGIGVAANSHSPYGPGFKGFGRLTGYQLLQDSQGEFFGTFLIPSLAHQDPRYRRMQHATVKRRIAHALVHTIIAQRDNGGSMLNYATLLTYPISAELSNLYVPGIQSNGPDTARRIGIGLATDPAGNLVAEFLPDIARRIHLRSVFIQQIVNRLALSQGTGTGSTP